MNTTINPFYFFGDTGSYGYSDTAHYVSEQVGQGKSQLDTSLSFGMRSKGVYDSLFAIAEECNEANWDGHGSEPVIDETFKVAYRFVEALPLGTPAPSVGVEADGHLTLEWYQNPDRVLSVSIAPDGMTYFAALLGSSRRSGTEPFYGEVSEDILKIIRRL